MVDLDCTAIAACIETFGVPVIYQPAAGGSFQIIGIFQSPFHRLVQQDDGTVGATEAAATLGVQLSQFPANPVQNDTLSVPSANTTFVVREVRIDGVGAAMLTLNKVSSP